MKRKHFIAIIALSTMMLGSSLSALAQDAIGIKRGMTKDEVRKVLGSPKVSSYITDGEIWQYLTGANTLSTSPDAKKIIIEFDKDRRVVAYVVKSGADRTLTFDRNKLKEELSRVPRGYGNNGYGNNRYNGYSNNGNNNRYNGYNNNGYNNRNNNYNGYGNGYMSEADFSTFYKNVKNATFASGKYKVIEVAGLGSRLSCDQVARIISLFTFSSEKMNALGMLAPRIADPENAITIYKQFTFSSEKDKAAEIISNSRR